MSLKSRLAVDIVTNPTKDEFISAIQERRKPCVITGMDVGECVNKWTSDYLANHGGDSPVKVHVSESPTMNFIKKNYLYKTLPFNELVKRASEEIHKDFFVSNSEYYYLRSLGEDSRKDVADVRKQFPHLAQDIKFPDFFPPDKFFSSVFRIASCNLQLWTHYDIMDNLLIQVQGKKRVVLFHPNETEKLYLRGDKSQIMNIDCPDLQNFPKFSQAVQYEAILNPGDVLFIPALWYHNVVALEFGVAVNVFWKNLDVKMYDMKDPYGNKDLVPAARVLDSLKKNLKVLENLPPQYKDFYGRRIVTLVKQKLYNDDCDDDM